MSPDTSTCDTILHRTRGDGQLLPYTCRFLLVGLLAFTTALLV